MEYFWIIYEYLEVVVHPNSISVAKAPTEVFLALIVTGLNYPRVSYTFDVCCRIFLLVAISSF